MKNKFMNIIYAAISAMILTSILFFLTDNEVVEKIGMFIIVFISVLFFSNYKKTN
ncbi:hypothetical protein HHA03_22400 [Halolactibacillus halophilus]|uniref:Uncharacterized protein n=1 Tax=Halolactibacillus halophilus TaxID=306540 RepID=A0ABQ0VNJ5_9BACI|nr:hypothetical protein HHA03_22400 [Halolactibacillus halophilus]